MTGIFFKQSDLEYKYDWTIKQDDPKLRGNPDHSLFNRHQGWEMLYFVNRFGILHNVSTVTAGKKVERMLRDHLPSDIRSQANVKQWVYDNWKKLN